ncbi:MAG: hypothetical protein MSG64_19965 [Pyrinomonadaceae bacterium MAG19_C2-C3]|nr:hypothetical protein [Pyrinomonadaceae bacterium MAG19_C2-C3]
MNAQFERLSGDATHVASPDSLNNLVSPDDATGEDKSSPTSTITLATLPVGARLIVKCRADWRTATISRHTPERITLTVHAPRGGTYRIRRPLETTLYFDGSIPILNATDHECSRAVWLGGMAHYDVRW